jgi:regulator of protease activity HflC (stomatin/prohibitin superfamily)
MSIVANVDTRIKNVQISDEMITADLADGRTISVPLAWSWRLSEATHEQRMKFELIGNGEGIHWSELDEDISVNGVLYGVPARRPKSA